MAKNLTAFLSQNAKKIHNVAFVPSDRFLDPETGAPSGNPQSVAVTIVAASTAGGE